MSEVKMKLSRERLMFIKGVVQTCTDEALLRFTPEGLEVWSVDPAHVMMVHILLSEKTMNALFTDRYQCTEPSEFGIDLDNLSERLLRDCVGNEFTLTFGDMYLDIEARLSQVTLDDYTDLLMVNRRFHNVSTKGMARPRWPKLGFKATITTGGQHLFKAVRMLAEVSDHMSIKASADGAALVVHDSYGLPQSIGLSPKPQIEKGEENVCSLFPSDYTLMIATALKGCQRVDIRLHNDMPVMYTTEHKGVKVEMLLAPQIESDG
jgi:hypothetical protein